MSRRARLVALLLPRRYWYRAAIWASRLQGMLVERLRGGNGRLTEALMLDHWLRELTFSGAYPIPTRVVEKSGLAERERNGGCCTAGRICRWWRCRCAG